jgi:hypothetical protein
MYISTKSQTKKAGNEFDMKGREAILSQEVGFFTTTNQASNSRKTYKPGTKVKLAYYQPISDLYIFEFPCGNKFPIRSWKFEWLEENTKKAN